MRLAVVFALSLLPFAAPETSRAAEGPVLPPAEYKPLPEGTSIEYDDRTYTVTRSEDYTTIVKKRIGDRAATFVGLYALFGEFGADLYVIYAYGKEPVEYDLASEAKKKLEAFWPLAVGKETTYQLNERGYYYSEPQLWTIMLKVTGTETVDLGGRRYETYVIEERGDSDGGMGFRGRKWYHPASGLIVRSRRTGTGINQQTTGSSTHSKVANLVKDEIETFSLRSVEFPPGTAAGVVAAAQGTTTAVPGKSALAEVERLKREAQEARRALEEMKTRQAEEEATREAKLAQLNREIEERRKRGAQQTSQGAQELREREAEIARLRSEAAERQRAAEASQARAVSEAKAREAEVAKRLKEADETRKAREAEIAKLKQEADQTLKVREAEIAKVKQEVEQALKAREAEVAMRLKQADEASKARATEIARLKREAETAKRAVTEREALEAELNKAREVEIARLRSTIEETRGKQARLSERETRDVQAKEAEIARLRKEAEERKRAEEVQQAHASAEAKAREAEIAKRLKEANEAQKNRDVEIAKLKQEAEQALKAREAEIAKLKQTLAERRDDKAAGAGDAGSSFSNVDFGRYHALVIGIDGYRELPKLKTAINDARAVAEVLERDYGFSVTLLIDPDAREIVDRLDVYRETLGPKDNLLIYYAGHGWLDQEVDRGYWLPVDARPKRRSGWVSNATVSDTLKALSAKHVMVVADSCYSGTLVRGADVGTRTRTGDYWKRMAEKWARVAITSGGLEPVADAGGGGHSPFAKAFIDALSDNPSVIDGTTLFSQMRRPVMVAARQTPQYADVREAGHDGGDFLFVRKK